MNEDKLKFLVAYAALCKKHRLCFATEAAAGLVVIEYDRFWVEDAALSEGVEMFESLQKEVCYAD